MKKKLVLMTSALMAVGLFASFANHQGNTVRVEAIEPIDVTIAKVTGASYSDYGRYYVSFIDKTGDMKFSFQVVDDDEIYQNHHLTPNKTYTLANMSTSSSYATISGEKFEYVTASLKLCSDENDYIGYEADVELDNGVCYSLHEADPMSGEMVIDEYKLEYGAIATLIDTETGSKFYFYISKIEDGVTYTLSDFGGFKYCYIGGTRNWNYREATFKRTTDAKGLIHVEATVLTEHGDSLSLKYGDPEPIAVTGVSLNKSSTTIKYGGNETLIATVSPEDAENKSVTWSSNDENVVTVDENGVLTTVAVGSATITVTTVDGNHKATCDVTVVESALSVTNRINALPTPENVTLDDKDAIEAARKAYDSLDADEKALVTTETLKKLIDDEAAYQDLVDTAAANAFANTFLSTTNGICVDSSKSSGDTNVSTLAAVWNVKETPDGSSLVEKWNALSIGAKSVFAEGTATEAIADAKARYVHIMSRYSEQLTAFDNGPVYLANAQFGFGSNLSNDATFIVTIVVVIAISTLILVTFLVIKKRCYN